MSIYFFAFLGYRFPMEDEDHYTRITLRIPRELHAQLNKAAFVTSKSQNAEIIARLQASFHPLGALSFVVQQAVDQMVEETGCSPAEALDRLVLAGQANGGTFLYATIGPNTTFQQFREMLEAGKKVIPPDAVIVMERGHSK